MLQADKIQVLIVDGGDAIKGSRLDYQLGKIFHHGPIQFGAEIQVRSLIQSIGAILGNASEVFFGGKTKVDCGHIRNCFTFAVNEQMKCDASSTQLLDGHDRTNDGSTGGIVNQNLPLIVRGSGRWQLVVIFVGQGGFFIEGQHAVDRLQLRGLERRGNFLLHDGY